jgi:hypothetical protein
MRPVPYYFSTAFVDKFTGDQLDSDAKSFLDRVKRGAELASLFGLLALPAFALRVTLVSGYNADVAMALLANSSVSSVINATVVWLVPNLLTLGSISTALALGMSRRPFGIRVFVNAAVLVFFLQLLVLSQSYIYMAGFYVASMLLIIGLGIGMERHLQRANQSEIQAFNDGNDLVKVIPGRVVLPQRAIHYVVALIAIPFIFVNLLKAGMWLPAERATIDGTDRTFFTLSEQADNLVVFLRKDRVVIRIPAKQVADRQYCQTQPSLFRSIHLPRCPDQ